MLWLLIVLGVIVGIVVVFALIPVGMYNGLVRGRLRVKESWSGIDVQLKEERTMWLALDAVWSRGTGDIETHFVPGGNASGDTTLTQFPRLDTKLSIVQASFNQKIRPNLGYALRYWFESWKEKNFASDFNQPYMGDPDNDPGSAQAIFLGLDFKDYTNHVLSFVLNYRF